MQQPPCPESRHDQAPGLPRAPGYCGQLQLQPQLPCDPVPEPPPPIGGSVIGGSQVARRSSSFSTSRFRCFMMPPPIRYKVTRRNQRGKAPVDGGNRHASVGDWTGVTLERRCTEATARGERNTGSVVDGVQACHACYVTAVTGARSTSGTP